ncbi:MAG: GNAT family N-acetyltransferase [Deltaproteobacteria bacterium]|nr:GNAT family N-acetyltransferase [Deltaproteobacteria bacterium]
MLCGRRADRGIEPDVARKRDGAGAQCRRAGCATRFRSTGAPGLRAPGDIGPGGTVPSVHRSHRHPERPVSAESDELSRTRFTTTLPDTVQIGGVYTPPEHRGKGYARAAVAGQLLIAREEGATNGVLFTGNPAAAKAYEFVGFRRGDDYHITLLRDGMRFGF